MLIGSWKVAFWHGGTRPDQQQVPSRWGVWHSPSGVADWAQDAPGLPSLPEARETKRRSFPAPRRANRPRRTPESPATSTPLASPTREHAASPAACGRHLRPRPCTGHLPPRPFPLAPAAGRQGSVVKPGPGNFTRGNSRGALRRRRQSVSFGGGGGGRGGEGGGGGWGGRGVAAVAAGTCAGMAEVPPGPSSLLPPPASPASAAAEPRCPFPAGAALACCSEDEEDDEEHEGGGGGRRPAGGEATTGKGHPCHRCPPPPQEQQQQQLNGLISPELRHLRAAASLKSKVLIAADAAATAATPDGGPRSTSTKGTGVRSADSSPRCRPSNARTALPSPAAAAGGDPVAARNGLAEGTEPEEEEEDEQVRRLSSSLTAGCSLRSPSGREGEPGEDRTIRYVRYESELQMPDIMRLITKDLSEPYSIYTYRYFIHNWPQLCFLAMVGEECVGAIVCKLDMHKKMFRRGYIAMLAVDSKYRRNGIGTNLVKKAIYAMVEGDCDEVVLETEITNKSALKLYENLGFVRDKRLFRYYLNGVDALRLKLWLR